LPIGFPSRRSDDDGLELILRNDSPDPAVGGGLLPDSEPPELSSPGSVAGVVSLDPLSLGGGGGRCGGGVGGVTGADVGFCATAGGVPPRGWSSTLMTRSACPSAKLMGSF